MPVTIADQTNVATTEEADTIFGKALDCITGGLLATDDAYTGKEVQAGLITFGALTFMGGCKWGRTRADKGAKPILGGFLG